VLVVSITTGVVDGGWLGALVVADLTSSGLVLKTLGVVAGGWLGALKADLANSVLVSKMLLPGTSLTLVRFWSSDDTMILDNTSVGLEDVGLTPRAEGLCDGETVGPCDGISDGASLVVITCIVGEGEVSITASLTDGD
jgi:hypothetical protein